VSLSPVQTKLDSGTATPQTYTFDTAPEAGNLLVAIYETRSDIAVAASAGWTTVGPAVCTTHSGWLFYKTAGVADTGSITITGATTFSRIVMSEWTGPLELDESVLSSAQAKAPSFTVGPVNASGIALVIGGVFSDLNDGAATYNVDPSSGFTTLDRGYATAALKPNYLAAYQSPSAATAYSLTGTADWSQGAGVGTGGWGGILLSFSRGPQPGIW
jgi:hypothetical protein